MYGCKIGLWILCLCSPLLAGPTAAENLTYTAKVDVPVCRDRETLDRVHRVLMSGDREAWKKLALEIALTGRCIAIEKGETVFGSVESVWSGVLRIRRKGDTVEYLAISGMFDWDQQKERRR
jgi:hypothetical protein